MRAKVKRVEPPSYVIVITWNNCDPEVYGVFGTEEDAEKNLKYIQGKWEEWEWGHNPHSSIEKLMEASK